MTEKEVPRFSKDKTTPPFPEQNISPPGLEAKMDPKPEFLNPEYVGSEKLRGKKALITGGDSGIGRAVAVLFAREGADVAITCLPEEVQDAQTTVDEILSEQQNGLYIDADLSSPESCEEVVSQCVQNFGRLDILVNNAAFQKHVDSIDDLTAEQFEHTFRVNIFGYFYMVKAALPYMNEGGSIINTSSVLAYEGSSSLIDYASTKGAIRSFTKSLASGLMSRSIRVNSVAPGPVWTPLNPAERKPEEVEEFGKKTLYKRPAQPEEIAPAFVYLASNITSNYVTGETINIFGTTSGGN